MRVKVKNVGRVGMVLGLGCGSHCQYKLSKTCDKKYYINMAKFQCMCMIRRMLENVNVNRYD